MIFEPDFSVVKPALNREGTINLKARFLVGYAGWAPGQLEVELARKDWIVIPGSPELVFSDTPFSVWRSALRKKGGIYWIAAETGFKPSIN